jgi:hypothetical protein
MWRVPESKFQRGTSSIFAPHSQKWLGHLFTKHLKQKQFGDLDDGYERGNMPALSRMPVDFRFL